MKRTVGTICVVLLVATSLIACGDSNGGGGDGDSAEPVKVGVVLSLTGPASSLGTGQRATVNTFRKQLSKTAGRPIEWIVEDDASDPTQAVAAVNRLISEGVAAVLCCTTSPNSLAIQPAIEQAQLTNIAMAGAADIVEPAREKSLFFKTPPTDTLTIEVAVDHMVSQGIDSAAFLSSDNAYGESGLEAFREVARQQDIEVTGAETFADTDEDMTAQLTKLRRGNPGAYVIWGIPPAAAIAQRNLRDLGIEEPAYQSFGVANDQFIELAGGAAEGVLIAAGQLILVPGLEGDGELEKSIVDFADRYRQANGERPSSFAGYMYDAMVIMRDALDRALESGADLGDPEAFRASVRDQVEKTADLVGVSGVYTYSPADHVGLDERAVTIIEVRDGRYVAAGDQ